MKLSPGTKEAFPRLARPFVMLALILALGACTSQAAREAELAVIEAEELRGAGSCANFQEEERLRAIEEQRRREAEATERARIAAEQQRRDEEARAARGRAPAAKRKSAANRNGSQQLPLQKQRGWKKSSVSRL
ncbi:MAG: hypothetical protein Ct9H300mP22_0790 [Gammaproteobacteria bacterium]|nr:MAG: hypothetical protein Ct9H300mP22_0790 [Gammaproteobacteria bacterium]